MVKYGHMNKNSIQTDAMHVPVRPVYYGPPEDYALDTEIYDFVELAHRVGDARVRGFERVDFYCMMFVMSGHYIHVADFRVLECRSGAMILLRPGQVHRFGDLSHCTGWMAIFRAESFETRAASGDHAHLEALQHVDILPPLTKVREDQIASFDEIFLRMVKDSEEYRGWAANALLRGQLNTLLLRLYLNRQALIPLGAETRHLRRHLDFLRLVERQFREWLRIGHYAKALGCSEKSLSRSTKAISRQTPREILTARITLEAKRQLANSERRVSTIGYDLGFSEATNFTKYFNREVGLTPLEFRRQCADLGA